VLGGGDGGALWEEDMGICCGDGGRKGGVWKCRRAKNVERNVNVECVVGHANVGCVNGTYIWSERADAIVSYNGVDGGRERSIGDTRNHYYFHSTLQHLTPSILTPSYSHGLCDIM
jgi:hypothetical protein